MSVYKFGWCVNIVWFMMLVNIVWLMMLVNIVQLIVFMCAGGPSVY